MGIFFTKILSLTYYLSYLFFELKLIFKFVSILL